MSIFTWNLVQVVVQNLMSLVLYLAFSLAGNFGTNENLKEVKKKFWILKFHEGLKN